jgi:hypothetical protein
MTSDQLLPLSIKVIHSQAPDENIEEILNALHASFLQSSNQKRIFLSTVQQLLVPFAKLDAVFPGLFSRTVDEILFHQTHIPEFVSVITAENGMEKKQKDMTSYPKHFFDLLRSLDETNMVLLHRLPTVLELFTTKVKSNYHSCLFYLQLQNILLELYPNHSGSARKSIVQVLTQLLRILKTKLLYRPSHDEGSQRIFGVFQKLHHTLLDWIRVPELTGSVLETLQVLLHLDFKVLGDDLESVWGFVLNPVKSDRSCAISFFCNLMESYVKLRQMPEMLTSLFEFLRQRPVSETDSILISDRVLTEFAQHIRKMLFAQSFEILKKLKKEIAELSTNTYTKRSKKLKSTEDNLLSPRIHAIWFVRVCQNIQIMENRQDSFDSYLVDFYENDLSTLFAMSLEKKKSFLRRILVPCLEIHLVSLQVSDTYWKRCCSLQTLNGLFERLEPFERYPMVGCLLAEIACCCIDRIVSNNVNPSSVQNLEQTVAHVWKLDSKDSSINRIRYSHIWSVLSVSTDMQVDLFLTAWFKNILKGDDLEIRLARDSLMLLEIPRIRNRFVASFASSIRSVSKSSKTLSKILKPLAKGQEDKWNSMIVDRVSFVGEQLDHSVLGEWHQLVNLLELFPVEYFSNAEREKLQWLMYLLERSLHLSMTYLNSDSFMILLRKLMLRFCKGRQDRLCYFYSFDILKWTILSVATCKNGSIQGYTQEIVNLVAR